MVGPAALIQRTIGEMYSNGMPCKRTNFSGCSEEASVCLPSSCLADKLAVSAVLQCSYCPGETEGNCSRNKRLEERTLALNADDVQGDHSGCSLGFVDFKTMAVFQYMLLLLKHNLCFDEQHLGNNLMVTL